MTHTNSDLNTPTRTRQLLIFILMLSLSLTLWAYRSHLWDRYRVVTDVQDYYWMALAQDPTLFARDYIYLLSHVTVDADVLGYRLILYPKSLGHGLLYYLASTVFDYIWLAKLSVLLLVPLCVIYMFKIGHYLEDNLTA